MKKLLLLIAVIMSFGSLRATPGLTGLTCPRIMCQCVI